MEAFTNFLANNYIWFIVITAILFCALIGYLVDTRDIKRGKKKKEELKIVDFTTVDNSKSLNESIKEEKAEALNLDDYQKGKEEPKKEEAAPAENTEEIMDLDEGEEKKFESEF